MKKQDGWVWTLALLCVGCVVAEDDKEPSPDSGAAHTSASSEVERPDAGHTERSGDVGGEDGGARHGSTDDGSVPHVNAGDGGTLDAGARELSVLDATTPPNTEASDAASLKSDASARGHAPDAGSSLYRSPTLKSFQEQECESYCGAVRAEGFPAIDRAGKTLVTLFTPATLAGYGEGFLHFYDLATGERTRSELLFTSDEDAMAKYGETLPRDPTFPEPLHERLRGVRQILEEGGYRSLLTDEEAKFVTFYEESALEFRVYSCEPASCPTSQDFSEGQLPEPLYTVPFDYREVKGWIGAAECSPFGVYQGPIQGGFEPERRIHAFYAPIQFEDLCSIEEPFMIWRY